MSTAEFAYNNYVNRSTGKSSFQIVNGYSPRTPIDLVPLPPHMRVSEPTENFAKHIHDLHAEIRRKISLSNEEYKLAADVHRRSKEFNVGDHVMVRIRPERIPKTFSKKLYARAMSPYSIIRKMGSNAYLLDLPNDMDISSIFNVEDLLPYRGTFEPSTLPFSVSAGEASKGAPTMPSLQFSKETVDTILDDEFVSSRDVGFVVFLSNDMVVLILMLLGYMRMIFVIWILHCWIATFPFTLRSRVLFNPEGMMGHGVGPYLGLNEIGSPSPMMNFIIINYLFNFIFGFI